jgi:hypothetical protein
MAAYILDKFSVVLLIKETKYPTSNIQTRCVWLSETRQTLRRKLKSVDTNKGKNAPQRAIAKQKT